MILLSLHKCLASWGTNGDAVSLMCFLFFSGSMLLLLLKLFQGLLLFIFFLYFIASAEEVVFHQSDCFLFFSRKNIKVQ